MYRQGLRNVAVDTGPDTIDFNFDGIKAYALMTGLNVTATPRPPASASGFLFVTVPRRGDPMPCQTLADGDGIYLAVGHVAAMRAPQVRGLPRGVRLACPGRA
jgi:hypothetical protein